MELRTLFIGTAPYGIPVLESMTEEPRIEPVAVVTRPGRKRGRGQEVQIPPVGKAARRLELPLHQPDDFNESGLEIMKEREPVDLALIVAYGQILKPEVYNFPRLGTYNFHASLLPRWRGAAPIRHALLNGDETTGVSLFKLVDDLDAGPVCVQKQIKIGDDEQYDSLYDRLSRLNCEVLEDFLTALENDELNCRPQTGESTYASRITKEDARINWANTADELERHVRAFYPRPGAYTEVDGERCIICSATAVSGEGQAGEVIRIDTGEVVVAAGTDALRLESFKPAGSREMECREFLAGRQHIEVGDFVGKHAS